MSLATSHKQLTSYRSSRIDERTREDGSAVFIANSPVQEGDLILSFGGSVLHEREMGLLGQEKEAFAIQIEPEHYLVPETDQQLKEHSALEHSCDSNLGFSGPFSLVARREIHPGEPFTLDCSLGYSKMAPFHCACGSISCRGQVGPDDHMHPEIRSRYRGSFTAELEKKHRAFQKEDRFFHDFNATGAWGLVTALDLQDCNPQTIRSADAIHQFTVELCQRIGVKRFGEPVIVHFGEDERVAGYSLVQLIETSLVSGHFANESNRVYLDIFSCAYYDPEEVTRFASNFFEASRYNQNVYMRY